MQWDFYEVLRFELLPTERRVLEYDMVIALRTTRKANPS
jgi:hypothetical protein